MSTFVDTSAFLAVLDADDAQHTRASRVWSDLVRGEDDLLTTSYVLVETSALVQARLGLGATRLLNDDVVPILRVAWVDEGLHRAAMTALLTAQRRDLSLVDCVSFEAMRRLGAERAFAFDRHFRQQGFTTIP
ncbi:MAG: type II toxin-antitoxin system VapC family toxin [Acidobacteria bacterium]|nr:type II toxin-antitoxin system VapC family toxin [Acidobacteriota bacterium]